MRSSRDKAEMVRDQVISKIHWGAGEDEVHNWLRQQHGISGAVAEKLIEDAFRARSAAIRKRAIMMLILSGIGLLIFGSFFVIQYFGRVIIVGWGSLVVAGLATYSGYVFLRSIWQLLSGRTRGGVEF